jgi:hypothetical protein
MITGAYKTQRNASALTFLKRYRKDNNEFLSHIIRLTGDETWVSFVDVETKEQSAIKAVDAHIHQISRKSLNKRLPARKLVATVFWDSRRVLLVEFMQQGTTISEVYRETLKKLHRAIQNKRLGMLTYGVVLLHDMGVRIQLLALEHCWSI